MSDAQIFTFRTREEMDADRNAKDMPVVPISSTTEKGRTYSPLHKAPLAETPVKASLYDRAMSVLDRATSIEFGRKAYVALLGFVAVASLGIVAGRTVIDESITFNPGMMAPDPRAEVPGLPEKVSPGDLVVVTATEGSNPWDDAKDALPENSSGADIASAAANIARQTDASVDGTRGYDIGETTILVVPPSN